MNVSNASAIFLVIISFTSACAEQSEPAAVVETAGIEQEDVVVAAAEPENSPTEMSTPESAPSKIDGARIVYVVDRDPEILNPYLFTRMVAGEAYRPMGEGLLGVNPDGDYFPVLAKEVPAMENGLVTKDGLMVTYPLKESVLWSDGALFTCDDILFTWQVVIHPESGAVDPAGYNQIQSVECPDAYTVTIKFNQFYAPYLSLFSGSGHHGILPRHATGNPAEMQQWSYNWFPIGTGPFKLQEWVPGEYLVYVPNENYREYPAKPGIDKLIIQIISNRETGKNLLRAGEVDVLWDVDEADAAEFADDPDIVSNIKPGPHTERLILNLANPDLDATDDPLNNPHWALGDLQVRRAIQYAIDKHALNRIQMFGLLQIPTGELSRGWVEADLSPNQYDPDKAAALLKEAGWIDKNGDGVRECRGCLYAEEGRPLRLKLQTTLGSQTRQNVTLALQEMLGEVGIDLPVEPVPASALFGSWAGGAFRKHGNFDVLMYTTGPGVDPQPQLERYFHKSSIPAAANNGFGANYSRWVNHNFSALLDEAAATADVEQRKTLYRQAMEILSGELPHIYLYHRNSVHLTGNWLQGFEVNPWTNQTWNIADWMVINK